MRRLVAASPSDRVAAANPTASTSAAAPRAFCATAHPGIDRHLIIHEESRAEVQSISGPDADIRHVRGLSRPESPIRRTTVALRVSVVFAAGVDGLPRDGAAIPGDGRLPTPAPAAARRGGWTRISAPSRGDDDDATACASGSPPPTCSSTRPPG